MYEYIQHIRISHVSAVALRQTLPATSLLIIIIMRLSELLTPDAVPAIVHRLNIIIIIFCWAYTLEFGEIL